MKLQLMPCFILTTEHPVSSCGQRVLVKMETDDAYRLPNIVEPNSTWGRKPVRCT
jgi:hypothetical protein